jgi:hypothetical protein
MSPIWGEPRLAVIVDVADRFAHEILAIGTASLSCRSLSLCLVHRTGANDTSGMPRELAYE